MRHNDFGQGRDLDASIRIPRPLRDLLRASRHGLVQGCRLAWSIASVAPGEWVALNTSRFIGAEEARRVQTLQVRAKDAALDMHMGFRRGAHVAAIGRRVIVVAEPIPDTVMTAVVGRPLSILVDGPFLDDPAITVLKVIHRAGERFVDVRCRCPSHVVRLPGA